MTKITIFSGFLGAGKTTLIKKLIAEAFAGEKLVLIENEFGEIGIDGGFLQDAGVQVTEMNSGCICCSLVGDFGKALAQVLADYAPDRILIEPSGVGKLSDVIAAVQRLDAFAAHEVELTGFAAVADATKCRTYLKNFGEFYADQIAQASAILLSRTAGLAQERLDEAVALLRTQNAQAPIVTTPWDALTGAQIVAAIERENTLAAAVEALEHETTAQRHAKGGCCGQGRGKGQGGRHGGKGSCGCGGHGHDDHAHGDACGCGGHGHEDAHEHSEACACGHDHDHGDSCGCANHDGGAPAHENACGGGEHAHSHNHSDHAHGDSCGGGSQGHHHSHDHEDACGCDHNHNHHHGTHADHHHADEVFSSFGAETARAYSREKLAEILTALDTGAYGTVLRAKGIVPAQDGTWLHFDFVPGEQNVRAGTADVTGRICVIGTQLNEAAVRKVFGL